MKKEKTYKIILSLCLISLIVVTVENLILMRKIEYKKTQLNLIEERLTNSKSAQKIFGYGDIIKDLDNKDTIEVKKFNQQKNNNTATVDLEIMGNITKIKELLKEIKNKENFLRFNNIKIEKHEQDFIARISVDFTKNK